MQLDPRGEQHARRRLRARRRRASSSSCAGGFGPAQRVHVAQPAAPFLQIGLEQERDLAGLPSWRSSTRVGQLLQPPLRPLLPLAAAPRRRARRSATRRRRGGARSSSEVAVSRSSAASASASRDGAHAVAELQALVPDRVPDPLGDRRPTSRRPAVQEHDVEVALRAQLRPAVAADRDQRARRRRPPAAPIAALEQSDASQSSISALWRLAPGAPVSVSSASKRTPSRAAPTALGTVAQNRSHQRGETRTESLTVPTRRRNRPLSYLPPMITRLKLKTQGQGHRKLIGVILGGKMRRSSILLGAMKGVDWYFDSAAGAATGAGATSRQRLRQPDQHGLGAGHGVPRVLHAGGLHGASRPGSPDPGRP